MSSSLIKGEANVFTVSEFKSPVSIFPNNEPEVAELWTSLERNLRAACQISEGLDVVNHLAKVLLEVKIVVNVSVLALASYAVSTLS